MEIYYKIYSHNKREGEQTDLKVGKWSLIWWILTNQFNKGVYQRREQIEIKIYK